MVGLSVEFSIEARNGVAWACRRGSRLGGASWVLAWAWPGVQLCSAGRVLVAWVCTDLSLGGVAVLESRSRLEFLPAGLGLGWWSSAGSAGRSGLVLTASGSRWWSRPGSRGGGEYGVRLAVEELRRGSRGGSLVAAEDGGGARMVTVSALGLGVLMGASVGLGFGYLGGVVVSAWGVVGLGLGWCGVGLGWCLVWCGVVAWGLRREEGGRCGHGYPSLIGLWLLSFKISNYLLKPMHLKSVQGSTKRGAVGWWFGLGLADLGGFGFCGWKVVVRVWVDGTSLSGFGSLPRPGVVDRWLGVVVGFALPIGLGWWVCVGFVDSVGLGLCRGLGWLMVAWGGCWVCMPRSAWGGGFVLGLGLCRG
uniref:Uncharacterized protein n=1 Tax=Fagus sylvatica TaxID=28930 RepID=A0A2N9EUV1_FAGSY